MKSFFNLLAISALLISATAGAQQTADTNTPPNPVKPGGTINAIKDVFLKGSIDGKHMFMVLGMEKGVEKTKDIADWIVTERDLDGYAHRAEKLADHVVSDKDDNYANATQAGIDGTKEFAPRILQRPWRSLQEIPKSFKVDLDNGREAYYNSKNGAAGAMKYSGWAAWAVIEGAYYLVIEAPVRFTLNLTGTVLSLPAAWTVQTLRVGYDVLCLGLRTLSIGIKAAVAIPAMIAVEGYSILSSTTATTLTLIAAGGLAIVKGTEFLFVEAPRRIFYPVGEKIDTGVEFNDKEAMNIANQVVTHYSDKDNELGITSVKSKIDKYGSRIDLFTTVDGETVHYGMVHVTIAEKMVHARIDISRKEFKMLKHSGMSRTEIKSKATESLKDAVKMPVAPVVASDAA